MIEINTTSDNKKPYFGQNGKQKFVIETPDWLKAEIIQEFGFYYDPCPVNPQVDGLLIDWPLDTPVYVNPPYKRGHIAKWVEKCHKQYLRGCKIILLIPAYVDTSYFHDYIYQKKGVELRFLRGRIKFKGYSSAASFPSMLVIFNLGLMQ